MGNQGNPIHLHLVSDSSGETVSSIARACLAQFEDCTVEQHVWWLIRGPGQAERVIEAVREKPGIVLYTIVDKAVRAILEQAFQALDVIHVPVLDPVLQVFSHALNIRASETPGQQHRMNAAYFRRIEAMDYTIEHDDGQSLEDLEEADVIIFGVSRSSKTPTSLYLANKGLKVVNIPIVPGIDCPDLALKVSGPLKVALMRDAGILSELRKSRTRLLGDHRNVEYVDEGFIEAEIRESRRLFLRHGFPIITVTRKSIEETAAYILQLHKQHQLRQAEAVLT